MTWKAMRPVVNLIDKVYSKGIKLNSKEKKNWKVKLTLSTSIKNPKLMNGYSPLRCENVHIG